MKLNALLLPALASFTALSVLAQAPNSAPPTPAPAPPAATVAPAPEPESAAKPAKPKHHKTKAKSPAAPAAPVVKNSSFILDPPVTATVKCNVLDVRGQGSFTGEIITYLKKGENVSVLEEITLGHVRAGEPSQWSRIVMPANTAVWVDGEFIDPDTMTVRAKKVNVRGGPGENYSIVARLEKGTVVKEIGKKESWLEIAAPTNAFAFVASEYLGKSEKPEVTFTPQTPPAEPPTAPAPTPAPAPPAVVNVAAEPAPPKPAEPASTGLTAPAPTAASQSDQEAALHQPPAPAPIAAPPEAGKQDGARIVTREGFVHRAKNIQAPEGYELHDIKTGVLTEYLQSAPGQASFKRFVGSRVRLTGSEFLDPQWPRTPVLHVETVDLMH